MKIKSVGGGETEVDVEDRENIGEEGQDHTWVHGRSLAAGYGVAVEHRQNPPVSCVIEPP